MTAAPALFGFVSVLALTPLVAQADTPPAPPAAPSRQVMSYDPAFFKTFQVQTALDMVNRVPGFTLQDVDNVRGFAGSAGNVLIDGQRPTSKTDSLSDILARMSAGSIERVDLIIGGADGIDMQGQTKIVNIVRKASDKPVITFVANSRILTNGWVRPAMRLTYARNDGEKSYEISGVVFNTFDEGANNGEKWIFPASGVPQHTEILSEAGGEGIELTGSVTHPLWGGKLSLNSKLAPNRYRNDSRFITGTTAVENFKYKEDVREGGFQYNRDLGKNFLLKLNGLSRYSHEEVEDVYKSPDEDTLFSDDSVAKETIAAVHLTWSRSEALSIEGGLEKAYNSRDSDTALSVNDETVDLPVSKVKVEENRTEASLLATWRLRPTLTMESGLKYEWSTLSQHSEYSGEKSFTYAKPRLQFTWSPKGPWQFTARFEREVGQLDFDDFVSSIDLMDSTVKAGNVSLEPDKTWVSELTANYRFWDKGALVLKYAWQDISDVIDRVPIYTDEGDVFDAKGNIGDGTAQQFTVDTTLPLDKMKVPGGLIKARLSLADSEVTDPVSGQTRRLSGESKVFWEINFSQDLPKRKFAWGSRLTSGFDKKIYRVKEVSYSRAGIWMNLFAEYKPTPKITWRIEAENILSRVYDYDRDRYDGPRPTSAISAYEQRRDRSEPWLFVRLRKEM